MPLYQIEEDATTQNHETRYYVVDAATKEEAEELVSTGEVEPTHYECHDVETIHAEIDVNATRIVEKELI